MNIGRYSWDQIRKGIKNPSLIANEIYKLYWSTIEPANNWVFNKRHGEPINVINQDYDNLIILDACRFDYFKEVNSIEGTLRRVRSCSSNSWGFIEGNFAEEELHDTIYVTSNPYVEKLEDGVFFKIVSLLDDWDQEVGTVQPETVVDETLKIHEQHDDKRIIAHFMQPHKPWIGPTAEKIRERMNLEGFNNNHARDKEDDRTGISAFSAVKEGQISQNEMEQAYRESLEIVLNHAEKLVAGLDGKTIVTADHGEILGERIAGLSERKYGHGHKVSDDLSVLTPYLHLVPWLEIESDHRREISAGDPQSLDRMDHEIRESRLKALGYKI